MSNGNRNILFVEANVMNISTKFQLHTLYGFWEEDFWKFFHEFSVSVAMATNQMQQLDKIHMVGKGLLKKHFCKKKNQNICSEIAINAIFHFSHCMSMATISCHSNQEFLSDWSKKHNYSFPRPIDAICEIWYESASWFQRRCHLNKCWRTTEDGCLPIL